MKGGLKFLNLSSNQFTHPLRDLFGFPQLEVLDLSFNRFTSGNFSSDLGGFPNLRSLNVSSNKLNGDVSTSMADCLQELALSNNQLNGSFPLGLFTYRNLTLLDLSQNNLTGSVPDEFMRLPNLETLLLSGNKLSGQLPESLSNVTTLAHFAANRNNFTGPIPGRISSHVRMLDLSCNILSGTISSDFLSHPGLQSVDISSNMLEGTVPGNLSQGLYRLRLGRNMFGGNIPYSICDAMSLVDLELERNQLIGNIPSELSKCKSLFSLNLASNKLHGPVPDAICSLRKLAVLKLQMNNLSGHIPSMFSDLANLSMLNLSQNLFTGLIPNGIFKLQKLSTLDLHGNSISGAIPTSISMSKSLVLLNLGYNALPSTIPAMPTTLSTALNLSHNYLSGPIPANIDSLSDLEIIDLSYNNLTGEVPSSLANLQSLTQVVLSYNNLSGLMPRFRQFVEVQCIGNPYLQNGTTNGHDSPTASKRRIHTIFIVIFAIIGSFVGLCVLAVILVISMSKKTSHNQRLPSEDAMARNINGHVTTMNPSAIELITEKRYNWKITTFQALDFEAAAIPQGLMEENLIGRGGSGHVHRVAFTNRHNGSTGVVAVKHIWSSRRLDEKLERQFESEVNILGNVRHKNIVKLLCCISNTETKLLVYDYMHNVSLDNWLHGHTLCTERSIARLWSMRCAPLDWPTRLRVAVGAAQGLCYMHHECSPPIIHRDVKTSNILLDSEFNAKVADFGLARMLVQKGEADTMSAVAGSFGYMAPEYAYTRKVNEKVDVYSFGVVLLELTTGKKANDGSEHGCLAQWAWHHYRSGASVSEATDKCIRYAGYPGEIDTMFRLGVQCTENSPPSRPTMKDVLRILLKCSEQTAKKTREERAAEHEAAPLFLPQRGSRRRWFPSGKRITMEEKIDFHCSV